MSNGSEVEGIIAFTAPPRRHQPGARAPWPRDERWAALRGQRPGTADGRSPEFAAQTTVVISDRDLRITLVAVQSPAPWLRATRIEGRYFDGAATRPIEPSHPSQARPPAVIVEDFGRSAGRSERTGPESQPGPPWDPGRQGPPSRHGRPDPPGRPAPYGRCVGHWDRGSPRHSARVAALAARLALASGWAPPDARLLYASGLLHDVGKICLPDDILLKSGPLSAVEYEAMKRHVELSAQIVADVLDEKQVRWIRGHHERWDGNGYPDRLAAEAIPEGARLLAVADAFHAMTEHRSYKPAFSDADALRECQAQAGRQFAPPAVDALLRVRG